MGNNFSKRTACLGAKFAAAALAILSMTALGEPFASSESTFIYVDTASSPFWRTATNNVVEISIDCPASAPTASLSVSGAYGFSMTTNNLTEGLFTLALPAANAALIMRAKGVNGPDSSATAAADCDLTSGPNIVGSYLPNAYGLYDMLGNVYEQCLDRSLDNMPIPTGGVDPRGYDDTETSPTGDYRVLRGCAYNSGSPKCFTRTRDHQTYNIRNTGFRVCLYPDFSL